MARNLDIAALRSLVAIADTQGVTRAAAQINLTQSAVSMQVRRLEDTFGAKLLLREGRGVALTKVGEQLVSYARRLIALNDETWQRLTNEDFEGDVVFGVPVDVVYPYVPQILRRASTLYPRIRVCLVSALTRELKQRMKGGELDLILATENRPYRGAETLLEAEHRWYGAANGKAHLRRPLPVSICNNCAQKSAVIGALDAAGIAWEVVGDTDSEITQNAIVSADLAVGPKIGAPDFPGCAPLPAGVLPELDAVCINLYTASHRDALLIARIAEVVRETLRCGPASLAATG